MKLEIPEMEGYLEAAGQGETGELDEDVDIVVPIIQEAMSGKCKCEEG
jgi:hypothetical protein